MVSRVLSSSTVSSLSSEESVITITSVTGSLPFVLLLGHVASSLMVTICFSGVFLGILVECLLNEMICVSGMVVISSIWVSGIMSGSSVGFPVGSSLTRTG